MNSTELDEGFSALHDRLRVHLLQNGLKQTRQREEILRAFIECGGHVSIDELLAYVKERHPRIGHATIYRTMRLFVDARIAAERKFLDGPARYETAEVFDEDHHDHLICTSCAVIVEFENDQIEQLQELVASQHGFELTSHKMELYGLCPNCRGAA
ncbi:MAG: transcriptional repressor [Rickettsiales bacterium]|nr:transcriptional repressor [Rickettsiales bacterium]|tara:strand:- start:3474 stop:3941 length:468 start_codon:yes stop_codon:yes gene_type:complete